MSTFRIVLMEVRSDNPKVTCGIGFNEVEGGCGGKQHEKWSHNLVLGPNNAYSGSGIVFTKQCSTVTWLSRLVAEI
jgi:hypothetical protein